MRSQVSSGQCGRVPAVNNDLPLDSENLTVQIYVLCPNFKNYNHPSESTNSDVAGIRSALVCVGVLGPGISGTFLIYLHSASKTHSRIGVCFIQSIKQQTIQVYNYLSFETSPQGQENNRLQSQWETSWEQLFAGDKACKLLWKVWEQKIKSDSTGPAHLSTWHVVFSWFIFTRPHHNFLILLSWSHPGFGRNIFIYLYFFFFEVRELQQENEGSLRKLQETAEQFEWLCQQQRYWMSCVKRWVGFFFCFALFLNISQLCVPKNITGSDFKVFIVCTHAQSWCKRNPENPFLI